jgi:hypothetical protein
MSGTYPNLLAGGITSESSFAPFELWAGEADLVTSQGTAAANLAQFTVVTRTGTTIAVWDGTTGKPIGFMAQPAVLGGPAVYYTGGVPNHKVLIWPAGVDTLDKRKAAFDGTNITISALL